MNKNEKEEIELNIEAKYVGRTETEFLRRVTYEECIYILKPENDYCDEIIELSLLKLRGIIQGLQKENEELKQENEELKQDKNNNCQMIALAQNEALGYMQGYEDGKKLKRSAIANILENQQYYIIKKEIEHYKEYIEKLKKENEELEEKVEKQEDIIKNALYIINKNEKEKIDRTWLYNFNKCATLKGDNK